MQKILILDPCCREAFGHRYQSSRTLIDILDDTSRFLAIHRKASASLDFSGAADVWRWPDLRTRAGRTFRQVARSPRYRAGLRERGTQAMLAFVRRAALSSEDVIMVHTAEPDQWGSLAGLARALAQVNGPSLHVRVLEDYDIDRHYPDDESALLQLAEAARECPGLHVYSEARELCDHLMAIRGFPVVRQWLTPMSILPSCPPRAKTDPRDCLVIGMPGGKRLEQGAALIPDIIRLLVSRHKETGVGRTRILLQKPAGLTLDGKDAALANHFMASLPDTGSGPVELEYAEPVLASSELKTLIERSHVLLLPYDARAYASRGSGLIVEAGLSGTPVVVTKGVAMADWQQLAGSPAASDVAGYVDAVLEVARDYQTYRDGAVRAGDAMRRAMADRLQSIRSGGD